MKLKSLFTVILTALLAISLAACGSNSGKNENTDNANNPGDKMYSIGIIQWAEHPSLDAAREGFIQALKDNGIEDKKTAKIDVQIAQGDSATDLTIAQKFAADKHDLILAIATPSAQDVSKAVQDTPILFTAVTDPVAAELVDSVEKPGGNVTGTSDLHPDSLEKLMEFIAADFPNVKKVGIVSNLGETNSVVQIDAAKEKLAKSNIEVVVRNATNTSEVKQAAESLIGAVDAIFIPTDNTAVEALESIIQVAEDQKLPLFVGEKDSVRRGGFASYGFEYGDLGYTTGKMAVEILKNGKNPAEMPVQYPEELDLVLNMTAAANMNIEVTDGMKAKVKDPEISIIE